MEKKEKKTFLHFSHKLTSIYDINDKQFRCKVEDKNCKEELILKSIFFWFITSELEIGIKIIDHKELEFTNSKSKIDALMIDYHWLNY